MLSPLTFGWDVDPCCDRSNIIASRRVIEKSIGVWELPRIGRAVQKKTCLRAIDVPFGGCSFLGFEVKAWFDSRVRFCFHVCFQI